MTTVDLNFGGVGELPAEGTYRVECIKAHYKPNKAGDGHIINMSMKMVDMYDENFENTMIFDNPSLKINARWRLKEMLEAFTGESWTEDDMQLEIDDDDRVPILEEATAIVVVTHTEYNDRPQLRIKNYLPDDGTAELGPATSL